MAGRTTLRVHRLAEIQRLLAHGSAVTIGQLTEELGVSEATVRRDLESLQESGLVQRTHGGAVPVAKRVHERPYPERSGVLVAHKQAIGRAAARMLEADQTVFIGGGSTTLRLAEQLPDIDLTVVTNSLPVADRLGHNTRIHVIVVGGNLRAPELSIVGPKAVEAIQSYRAEIAFLGVPALDAQQGFTADGDIEAATDSAFMTMARRTVVLADHSKIGRVSTTHVAPLSAIDTVVTDDGAALDAVRELRAHGADVVVAEVATHG